MNRNEATLVPVRAFEQSIPTLDHFISQDQSFASAIPRLLAAIACDDGPVTAAEFAVLTALIAEAGRSTLFASLLMDAVHRELKLDRALDAAQRASASVGEQEREAAWEMLEPMLHLQHARAREIARQCCEALRLPVTTGRLASLPPGPEGGTWPRLWESVQARLSRSTEAEEIEALALASGNQELHSSLQQMRRKQIDVAAVQQQALEAADQVRELLSSFAQQHADVAAQMNRSAELLDTTAAELRSQVEQRLAVLEARLQLDRRTLKDDIDETVHDAGNAVELAIRERLATGKWKDKAVWDGIARHTLGPEMERRLSRLVQRRQDSLELLQKELRLFRAEIRLAHATLSGAEHRSALAALMPRMGVSTQLLLLTRKASNVTLFAGTPLFLVALNTSLATIALPAVPLIGGAVVAAGLFKWFTSQEKWKESEIANKRQAFEDELRARLLQVQVQVEQQLDGIAAGFVDTARCIVEPVLLEAQAAKRLTRLHQRLAEDVTTRCRTTLQRLPSTV